MHASWYRRKLLYVIIVVLLLLAGGFGWRAYTSSKKADITNMVESAVTTAFQSVVSTADPNSLEKESWNDGPFYLIPQFGWQSQVSWKNDINLRDSLLDQLNNNQRMPMYKVASFGASQMYDQVNIEVKVKYEVFAGITDTASVQVKVTAPKKPAR